MGTISKKQEAINKLNEEIKLIEDASKNLNQYINHETENIETFSVILKHIKSHNSSRIWSVKSECEKELNRATANKLLFENQLKCEHDVVWDVYDGHDSHKDYYKSECKKCKLVIETYSH